MFVFVLCVHAALALGIRPTKTEIDYQPMYAGSFKVVNNDHQELHVFIYAEGELGEYIHLSQTELELGPEEEFRSVDFALKLTDELPPGTRIGKIIVEEKLSGIRLAGSYVTANLKVAHKIAVNVPTPDKYVEAKLDVKEQDKGVDIVTTVKNIGKQDIREVQLTVDIYSGTQKISTDDDIPAAALKLFEERDFKTYVEKEQLGQGQYTVRTSLSYDQNTLELAKTFTVGEPIINIVNYERFFAQNRINEFPLELKSEWNNIIKDVHLELSFFKRDEEVFKTKAPSFDVEPYEEKKIISYFDARGLELGPYDLTVTIIHGSHSTIEKYRVEVITEEDYVKKKGGGGKVMIYFLVGAVILIVILLAVLFYFVLSMKKKQKNERQMNEKYRDNENDRKF